MSRLSIFRLLASVLLLRHASAATLPPRCPNNYPRPPNNTYHLAAILQRNTGNFFLDAAFVVIDESLHVIAAALKSQQIARNLPVLDIQSYFSPTPDNRVILQTTLNAIEGDYGNTTMALFGSILSDPTRDISTLASLFSFPHIDPIATSELLDDKSRYPFFIRAGSSFTDLVNSWAALLQALAVRQVSIVLLSSTAAGTVAEVFVGNFLARNISVATVNIIPSVGATQADYDYAWATIEAAGSRYVHVFFSEQDGYRFTYYGLLGGYLGGKRRDPYVIMGMERPLLLIAWTAPLADPNWGLPPNATTADLRTAMNGVMSQSDFPGYSQYWLNLLQPLFTSMYNTTGPVNPVATTLEAYLALLNAMNLVVRAGYGCYLAGANRSADVFMHFVANSSFMGMADEVFYDANAARRSTMLYTTDYVNGSTFVSTQYLRYYYNGTFSTYSPPGSGIEDFPLSPAEVKDYVRTRAVFNTIEDNVLPPDGPIVRRGKDVRRDLGLGLGIGLGGFVLILLGVLILVLVVFRRRRADLPVVHKGSVLLQNVLVVTQTKGTVVEGLYAGNRAIIHAFKSRSDRSNKGGDRGSFLGSLRRGASQTVSARSAQDKQAAVMDSLERIAAALQMKAQPRAQPPHANSSAHLASSHGQGTSSRALITMPVVPKEPTLLPAIPTGPMKLRPSAYQPVELADIKTETPVDAANDSPAPSEYVTSQEKSGDGRAQVTTRKSRASASPPFSKPSASPLSLAAAPLPLDLLMSVRHPQIVRCEGFITAEGDRDEVIGAVYEGMPQSLRQTFENIQSLSLETRLRLVLDIVRAVAALQDAAKTKDTRAAIYGRVVRFEKIWLTSNLRAKLALDLFDSDILESSEIAQTAPEILHYGTPTALSDVYTCGVICHLIVSRQTPIAAYGTDRRALRELAKAGALRHSLGAAHGTLPAHVVEVLSAMVAYAPGDRPLLSKVAAELEEHLPDIEASTRPNAVDDLIESSFPPAVAACLRRGEIPPPVDHPTVNVFFADIVGFTKLCAERSPQEAHEMIDRLFQGFDELATKWNIQKIESIGDGYFAVTNMSFPDPLHTSNMCNYALEAMDFAERTPISLKNPQGECFRMRMGINTGPVVSCVVGRTNPRYTLLGDTVNLASRAESTSLPGEIQITESVVACLLSQSSSWAKKVRPRGEPVEMKNKGAIKTYFLERRALPVQEVTESEESVLGASNGSPN